MVKPTYIERFRHTGVNRDGTFKREAGAVNTKAGITISAPHGGCGSPGCRCSPGHWICIGNKRTAKGTVTGKTLHFRTRKDLLQWMKDHKIGIPKSRRGW